MSIVNGNTKTISECGGSLPNLSDALTGWYQPMTVEVITKSVVDFQLSESAVTKTIKAVRQPFSSKQLILKPEGQRAWSWETMHTTEEFSVDDIFVYKGIRYRVMQKWNWTEYGYFEYHIVQGFTE